MTSIKDNRNNEEFPWYSLLDIELKQKPPEILPVRPRGRPKMSYDRVKLTVYLSSDQTAMVNALIHTLEKNIGSQKVTRGNLMAFAVARLYFAIRKKMDTEGNDLVLPPDVKSFTDLARFLDSDE
ncbi:MAG TPA: hypothetical protein PKW33_11210 [Anaerolineaceae bacterium]|nr:hypothetical protein [Anaerolineaceae bacterium]HPN52148.1 hypothetical protein [Anaerolineaceae bacterium]